MFRLVVVCALLAAMLPCTAQADSPPDLIGRSEALRLDLVGRVPSHCGFETPPPVSAALGDLAQAGSYALTFTLDCNAAFRIGVQSANGGLAHVGVTRTPQGFAASLDYGVALSFATDLGTVSDQCTASALSTSSCMLSRAHGGLSSGDGVSVGKAGSLTVSWRAPGERLLAGEYQDSIVITVEACT